MPFPSKLPVTEYIVGDGPPSGPVNRFGTIYVDRLTGAPYAYTSQGWASGVITETTHLTAEQIINLYNVPLPVSQQYLGRKVIPVHVAAKFTPGTIPFSEASLAVYGDFMNNDSVVQTDAASPTYAAEHYTLALPVTEDALLDQAVVVSDEDIANAGILASLNVTDGGTGFAVGDLIDIGGAVFSVASVSGSAITSVALVNNAGVQATTGSVPNVIGNNTLTDPTSHTIVSAGSGYSAGAAWVDTSDEAIASLSQSTKTFYFSDLAGIRYARATCKVRVVGSTGNNGTYTITAAGITSSASDALAYITVSEAIPSAVADGTLQFGANVTVTVSGGGVTGITVTSPIVIDPSVETIILQGVHADASFSVQGNGGRGRNDTYTVAGVEAGNGEADITFSYIVL